MSLWKNKTFSHAVLLNHGLGDALLFYALTRKFKLERELLPIVKNRHVGEHLVSIGVASRYLLLGGHKGRSIKFIIELLLVRLRLFLMGINKFLVAYGDGKYWLRIGSILFLDTYVHSEFNSRELSRQSDIHKKDLIIRLLGMHFTEATMFKKSKRSSVLSRKKVIIFPSSGEQYKTIPPEVFLKICDAILKTDPDTQFEILGSSLTEEEVKYWRKIDRNVEHINVNYDRYTGVELHRYLRGFASFIGGDNGLAHCCAYEDVPGITLFGPTNPFWTGPLTPAQVFTMSLPCSPCQGGERLVACSGRRDCFDYDLDKIVANFSTLSSS